MRNGLVRTLVVSLIVVLLLTQKHSGFMLAFVLLFLVPWFAYSGYRCLRFPIERKLRIQKTIVWFVAVVVIVSVHLVMYRSAKSYALGVSEKIETYISSHGSNQWCKKEQYAIIFHCAFKRTRNFYRNKTSQ